MGVLGAGGSHRCARLPTLANVFHLPGLYRSLRNRSPKARRSPDKTAANEETITLPIDNCHSWLNKYAAAAAWNFAPLRYSTCHN